MVEIASFGNKRSYQDFKKHVPISIVPLFDSIREFCLGIEDNVIEDVRMHRVVFCKSITFRWFVDIEPDGNKGTIIKIQKSRKEPVQIINIGINQNISKIKQLIKDAYDNIH